MFFRLQLAKVNTRVMRMHLLKASWQDGWYICKAWCCRNTGKGGRWKFKWRWNGSEGKVCDRIQEVSWTEGREWCYCKGCWKGAEIKGERTWGKEGKFQHLKRRFEEERRVNERNKRRQYRMEREVGELKQKVSMWEREEERMRERERIREKKKCLYERG